MYKKYSIAFPKIPKVKTFYPVKFVDHQLKYILFDCFYIVVLSCRSINIRLFISGSGEKNVISKAHAHFLHWFSFNISCFDCDIIKLINLDTLQMTTAFHNP